MSIKKGVPLTGGTPRANITGVANPNPTTRTGVAPTATLGRPSVRTVTPTPPPEKPASTVASVIDTLRNGGALDAAIMAVVADDINAKFEQLRSSWGGKLYFSPAEVRLFDDRDPDMPDDYTTTYLAFRKQDKGWNFVLEEVHVDDSEGESLTFPLAAAPLDVRLQAIAALPELEEKLKKERDALARALVSAYDRLTSFVENSAKPDKETTNGTV